MGAIVFVDLLGQSFGVSVCKLSYGTKTSSKEALSFCFALRSQNYRS